MKKTEAKSKKTTDKLEAETKDMEAQLEQLKKIMTIERQRREELKTSDGGIWKSGDKSKQLKGYGQAVLDKHKKELARAKKRILKHNAAGTLSKENQILKDVNKVYYFINWSQIMKHNIFESSKLYDTFLIL